MKKIGKPTTTVEIWLECTACSCTANNGMVILFDSQGYIRLEGTCECGKRLAFSFSLSEIIPEWRNNERG